MNTAVAARLGISYPIFQGPFGGGLSSAQLVAAVCNAGGLGCYGANTLDGRGILKVVRAVRALTTAPFGLNLWVPDSRQERLDAKGIDTAMRLLAPYYRELGIESAPPPDDIAQSFPAQVEALLEARPALFSFVFGIPSPDVLRACRERNIITAGTATTVDEALAIEAAGVDFVIASGFEAGGHRGSFLRPAEESLVGAFALISQVTKRVRIPVVAAGAIADGRGVAAALALGASAAQIGTAFLACDESGTNELHRAMVLSLQASDTALSRAFSGRLARGVRNGFTEEMKAHEHELPSYPIQNWLTARLRQPAIERGRPDLIALSAGQAASLARRGSAVQLMAELVRETGSAVIALAG